MADRTCSVEGCERKFYGRDLCNLHYQRMKTHGSTDDPRIASNALRQSQRCSVEGCDRGLYGGGMCKRHRQRVRRHGSAADRPPRKWNHTPEARAKISDSHLGEKNPMYGKFEEQHPNWAGDAVGYCGLHDWMTARYGQPVGCEFCGTDDPCKRYEWANISGQYRRARADFVRLCKKCHNDFDGVNVWQQARG